MLAASAATYANQSEKGDRLWPQVHYDLLRFDRADQRTVDSGDVSWTREELLREALQATAGSTGKPLIEGWISSTAYGRLYWDHEIYLNFAPKLGTPLAQVCRVMVTGLPDTLAEPQGFAGGGGSGDKWCTEPGRAEVVPTPAEVRAMWRSGPVNDTAVFQGPGQTALTVMHVVGDKRFWWPVPPAHIADVLTVGRLPVGLAAARRIDRTLLVARLSGGGWGLMLKYEPSWTNLSGCFVTAASPAAMPSEQWITPQVENWCRDHAANHFSSLLLEQKPNVPVIVGSWGQTPKSWDDKW